jgi:hypothetical protein
MVDKAIIIENKLKEMEKNGKRKMSFPKQSSGSNNTRPRLPQPRPLFRGLNMVRPPLHGQRPTF